MTSCAWVYSVSMKIIYPAELQTSILYKLRLCALLRRALLGERLTIARAGRCQQTDLGGRRSLETKRVGQGHTVCTVDALPACEREKGLSLLKDDQVPGQGPIGGAGREHLEAILVCECGRFLIDLPLPLANQDHF